MTRPGRSQAEQRRAQDEAHPVRGRLRRALWLGLGIAAVLGVLHGWGVGLSLLLALLVAAGAVAMLAPRSGVRWLDEAIQAVRSIWWRRESGRHHSFAGVMLDIEEDGGLVWMSAASLQAALRRPEPATVTAARLAGLKAPHAWRNDEGVQMLNVQAVVLHLAQMPDRMEPRVLRLRRYLEREVLYPAGRRAGAAGATPTAFEDSGPAPR
jgi:hypothetical protein